VKDGIHTAQRHDSALRHVTGQALYIDDIPEPPGSLHAALVLSPVACGRLTRLDLAEAAASPGVVAAFAARDIPGHNNVAGPGKLEPLFAEDKVEFAGQALAVVVADTMDAARAAAERAVIEVEPVDAILDIAAALARQAYVQAPSSLLRGDPDSALKAAVGGDWKGKLSSVLYAVGIVSTFWVPWLAQVIYVSVALLWLVPDRRIEHTLERRAEPLHRGD